MPSKSASQTSTQSKSDRATTKGPHALTLLKEEHATVEEMFDRYEKLKEKGTDAQKAKLAGEICYALTRHAEMEEAIFYPALRKAIEDQDILDEADVEHAGAKDLIAQIRAAEPGDDHYDAKVKVLGEGVKHHVKEEEGEMFKEARAADLDFNALGAEMKAFIDGYAENKTRAGKTSA